MFDCKAFFAAPFYGAKNIYKPCVQKSGGLPLFDEWKVLYRLFTRFEKLVI